MGSPVFRRQTPQTGNAVVAMVMNLNIAGLHPEAIGVLPGIFGKIHGIAMQRKYGVYCGWLFDVLFELERRLDISEYDPVSRRVFGYVGERLLDVWVETNHIAYTELPVVNMERQNWLKKGSQFLLRKWKGMTKHD